MPTLRKRSEQCFVNLFVNYADESGRDREVQPDIKVFIAEEGDQVRIEITDINGSPCLWSERLFESLWSEKRGWPGNWAISHEAANYGGWRHLAGIYTYPRAYDIRNISAAFFVN